MTKGMRQQKTHVIIFSDAGSEYGEFSCVGVHCLLMANNLLSPEPVHQAVCVWPFNDTRRCRGLRGYVYYAF